MLGNKTPMGATVFCTVPPFGHFENLHAAWDYPGTRREPIGDLPQFGHRRVFNCRSTGSQGLASRQKLARFTLIAQATLIIFIVRCVTDTL